MNCIFCQEQSASSKSVEHIIPESLGNNEYILEKGWVCDKCNNYFSIKIEQPLLQIPFFNQHRHDLDIKSKKGRIPSKDGFLLDDENSKVTFLKDKNKQEIIDIDRAVLEQLLADGIEEIPAITVTYGAPKENPLIAKFLGKVGIELLAYEAKLYRHDESYYNQESLNNIKSYVRQPKKNETWRYTTRQLYHPDGGFQDENGYLKVICSWKFIITSDQTLLLQFLFVGTEFTVDMINPDTQSIEKWYHENNNVSHVYESLLKQYPIR